LTLEDVYGAITYYLGIKRRAEYLRRQEAPLDEVREKSRATPNAFAADGSARESPGKASLRP